MQPEGEEQRHPFGLYKSLVAELSGNPRSEHTIRYGQEAPLDAYADLFEQCQFFVVTGHLAERSTQGGTLRLAQGGKLGGDTVFTAYPGRIRRGIDKILRSLNYNPPPESLQKLLEVLEEVGGEGLFATISDKEAGGFSRTALRGQLGLAVALDWYYASIRDPRRAVLSLDTHLAKQWLRERDDQMRPDLLGFGIGGDGRPRIDVIEVKSYEATGDDVAEAPAVRQIISVARLLRQMLDNQGNLLIDRRRELLRLQLYRERLASGPSPDPEWVRLLNDVLDGQSPVSLNLLLIELGLDQNVPEDESLISLESEEAATIKAEHVKRVRLSEPYVRRRLQDMVGIRPQPQEPDEGSGEEDTGSDGLGTPRPDTPPLNLPDSRSASPEVVVEREGDDSESVAAAGAAKSSPAELDFSHSRRVANRVG